MYSVHVRTSVFSSSVYSYTVRDTRDSTFAVWLVLWGFFGNEYFPNGHARPAPRDRNISRRAACNFPKTVCDDLAVRKKGGFTRARIGRVVVLHKQASKLSHRQASFH